ncbi:methyltransferase domain-containing protein [Streptosporangium sp. NPDC023825]|uniref:class I SAM-dependent methyltransferase n=1 Tax=Streptosporangium sp. NPDC023825 TaxID=3154909 RepID=UPI003416B9D5
MPFDDGAVFACLPALGRSARPPAPGRLRRGCADRAASSGARHVLDAGCGTGNLAALPRRRAATVTGLEPDPATARAAAERFADNPTVAIVQADFAGRDRGGDGTPSLSSLSCTTSGWHLPCVNCVAVSPRAGALPAGEKFEGHGPGTYAR